MYQDKITLSKALELKSQGEITIVDGSPDYVEPWGTQGRQWKDNFRQLRAKARHISPDKILSYYSAKYLIESFEGWEDDTTCTWRYFHGIENTKVKDKTPDDIEYVYIMVNPGYPDLVKIGATVKEVLSRAKGINTSGTVDEWIPKFALPVRRGCAFKVENTMHKVYNRLRVNSSQGHSREFFRVDPLTAFDTLREVGALFQVGNPIVY
jgi:hypothetical protein